MRQVDPGGRAADVFAALTTDGIAKMRLSARNQLKGRIAEIEKGAVNSTVRIDLGGGNEVTAVITNASVEDLGLEPGKQAYAVIKSTEVMIGVD